MAKKEKGVIGGPRGGLGPKSPPAWQAAAKNLQKTNPTKAALRKRAIRERQRTNRALGAGSRFAGGAAG